MCSSIQCELFVVDQRGRAIGAHAAGVRADVAVVGRLVVLGRLQGDDRAAVGNRQHAGLLAVEPLLDHQAIAGGAENLLPAICSTARIASLAIGANHHALAGRQSVGLDDDGHVFAVVEKRHGFVGDRGRPGNRPMGTSAWRSRSLQKTLLPSNSAALRRGPNTRKLGLLEGIDDSGGQRRLRADDGQADVVLLGEFDQAREIGRA